MSNRRVGRDVAELPALKTTRLGDEDGPRVPRVIMDPPAEPGLFVNEIFYSIQGEGRLTGLPTVFLRTAGCHLRCSWCDTTYSFHEGTWVPMDDLKTRITAHGIKRLCLTGGEPLLQRDAWALVTELLHEGWDIDIETSGSIDTEPASTIEEEHGDKARKRLTLSVDVKCPSSDEQRSFNQNNLNHLRPHDQIKFIIADEDDYAFAKTWITKHQEQVPCAIYMHPEGGGQKHDDDWMQKLAHHILDDRLDVRLGIQLHKILWGDERGA